MSLLIAHGCTLPGCVAVGFLIGCSSLGEGLKRLFQGFVQEDIKLALDLLQHFYFHFLEAERKFIMDSRLF